MLATGFAFPVKPRELHPRPQGQPPRVQGGGRESLGSVAGLPAAKPPSLQSPSELPRRLLSHSYRLFYFSAI